MKPLRIGIVGAGNVLEAYVPQCAKLQGRGLAELVNVCGRSSQRDRAMALGAPRFTTSESEILNDSNIDLVVVLTSMPDHARAASAALRAGKHVMLEKPLATNLQDGAELLKVADQSKRVFVCAPFVTISPTFQTIARRIRAGDIGKPHLGRARYGWAGPWWAEWFYKPGGGCLFDLGIYPITSLTALLGPAKRVTAFMGVAIPEREINGRSIKVEVEDNAQILIDFGGCYATVMSGFTMQQYRNPAVEIYGGTGTIQMLADDWDPDGYEIWQNAAGCWQVFKETAPDWPWADGLRHMVECLHAGKEPIVTKEHAFHVLEIILKAQQSAKEGRAVAIESSFAPKFLDDDRSEEPAHLAHDRTREHLEL
jgi:predicted dehydrogenase